MSIGNLKNTGNQGNNWPWQYKVLQGLQCICDELKEININTDDIETLLQDIIDQLVAGLDVTVVNSAGAAAVNIQDGGNIITVDATDLDIRNLDCTTDSVSICDGGGNPLAIDSTGNINSNLYATDPATGISAPLSFQGLGTANALDVFIQGPLGNQDCDNAVAVTLCNTQDQYLFDIKTAVEGTLTTDTLQLPAVLGQTNMAGSVSVTLANNQLGIARTPTILRTSASSSVAAGTFSMSFASVGTADATVGGQILKPGETINFDAGAINNTIGAVVYDSSAAGAELLIITLT